jgi:hypothetical protein
LEPLFGASLFIYSDYVARHIWGAKLDQVSEITVGVLSDRRSSSGSLAKFAAMRRASSLVSSLVAGSFSK